MSTVCLGSASRARRTLTLGLASLSRTSEVSGDPWGVMVIASSEKRLRRVILWPSSAKEAFSFMSCMFLSPLPRPSPSQVFGAKYEPVEVLFVDAAYHVVRLVGLVVHDKHAYAHGQQGT